jgi:hypothetical protein
MPEITTSHGGEIEEDWYPELEQLPERPRRKLLTPSIVLLALVLFAACGFIGGVLVQKGQGSTGGGAGASTFASRFGAGASGASGASGAAGTGGFASRFSGLFGGGAGGGTSGTVSSISGNTLYVTETSGNTVAVVTTPESKIKKSESVSAGAIHPGDTVVVEGITGSTGTVVASSVTDSGASATSTSSSSSTSTSGVASLFGR